MDYPYELLGPERFQELCQSLVTKEFDGLQCYPVAQPDGGRDAVRYLDRRGGGEYVVFQVQFVRNPGALSDRAKWLADIVQKELPKILQLIPRGAKHFFLLTNVKGSSHLDSGTIDLLHEALTDMLPIPATALWRDDLNRRLDAAWDLKWVYPELLTGPDLLRSIVEAGLSEDKERRSTAIRAYVQHQYAQDEEVRFKQIELQNKLLDLFTDVPLIPPREHQERRPRNKLFAIHRVVARDAIQAAKDEQDTAEVDWAEDVRVFEDDSAPVGGAFFMLHPLAQAEVPRLVLEGAPGQGKSTIGQYICQVHRTRILNRQGD